MQKGVLSFKNVIFNESLINEIFQMNPLTIPDLDGRIISQYMVALAQYLVYFKAQVNELKAEIYRISTLIDNGVSMCMSDEKIKKFKSKKDATIYLINTTTHLTKLDDELKLKKKELMSVEGMDKPISELIATLKRELTRRENELYATRMERR
jgi:hypothetical protein